MTAVVPKQLGNQGEIFQGGSSISGEMSLECLYRNGCNLVLKWCDFHMCSNILLMVSSPSSLEEKLAKYLLTNLKCFLQDVHLGSERVLVSFTAGCNL